MYKVCNKKWLKNIKKQNKKKKKKELMGTERNAKEKNKCCKKNL